MKLNDFLMRDASIHEKIVIVLTVVVLVFVFTPREKPVIDDTNLEAFIMDSVFISV